MVGVVIVYRREIPGQVMARAGRNRARRALDGRFQAAIARAAVRAKKHRANDTIERRRRNSIPCGDDPGTEAAAARILEAGYRKERLEKIIKASGIDEAPGT